MTALDVLGWAVIHSAWQAALISAVVAVFLYAGGASTRLRYATSFGALLTLPSLPLVTAALLMTHAGGDAGVDVREIGGLAPGGLLFAAHSGVAPAVRWVAAVWLAGVVVLLLRWIGGWWIVARMTARAARPARAAWQHSLRVVAVRVGVGSPVALLESAQVDTPLVVGHRRPVVVLPVPAFETLAGAEVESVLAHELAHVRRGDFAANAVQALVEILFFFHPAVRWLSRTVRDQREQCCDDVAVRASGSRLAYVRALARLESLRAPLSVAGLALGAGGGTLLRRLERLVAADAPSRGRTRAPSALILSAATALSSLALVGSVVAPPTLHAFAASRPAADRHTVYAHDPAGAFSVTFERGRPTRAIVGGVVVTPGGLVTRGDSLFLPWRGGAFALRLKPDGFTWTPRRAPRA